MSDLNLADWFRHEVIHNVVDEGTGEPFGSVITQRQMTPADVVELARQLPGAEVVDSPNAAIKSHPHSGAGVYIAPGRYLVLPLDGEKEQ